MKKATQQLCKRSGVSITERRGKFRVKLGIKITGAKPIDKLVGSEDEAVTLVEYWLNDRTGRTMAASFLNDGQLEDAKKAFELLTEAGCKLTLTEVARKHTKSLPGARAMTIEDFTVYYYKNRAKLGRKESYLNSLQYYFKNLNLHLGNKFLHEIQAYHLEDYLDDHYGLMSAKTYNNHLGIIVGMWKVAKLKKFVSINVALEVEKKSLTSLDVGILTPIELKTLIEGAKEHDPIMVIPIALQAFAGIRRSESSQLTWGDIKGDTIAISSSISKTNSRRTVPILPPLRALLKEYSGEKSETIYKGSLHYFQKRRLKLTRKVGITNWPHNALRHSFVSYRLIDCHDDSKVALEAGHSVQMLHKHYKSLIDDEEKSAKEYWNLFSSNKR